MTQQLVEPEKVTSAPATNSNDSPIPDDPNRHTEVAGITLAMIIGGIALVMIVVMVIAFVYFNNFWEGPTTFVLPLLG